MNERIKVQVPVGQRRYADPYIRGRNGDFEITALRIHQWGAEKSDEDCGCVDIHGIGKREVPIVGGFRCIRTENIDALCKAWIEARGGIAILPGDDGATALVTMCGGVIDNVVINRDAGAMQLLGEMYVGESDPDKWEYHLRPVEVLPRPDPSFDDKAP